MKLETLLLSALFFFHIASAFVVLPIQQQQQLQTFQLFSREADSSLDVHNLRSLIDNLAPDNFDKSLELMEPLLVNECVGEECEMYLSDLNDKCKSIGKTLPAGFAPTHH